MKNIKKRLISLFLASVMVFSCMPVGVLASETTGVTVSEVDESNDLLTTEGFAGKTISILGDSISTYTGVSNNASYNATIGSNAVYYTAGRYDVYQADTWWQQVIDALGMELLVNNSWSGSCILHTRSNTVGAYVDRCVQLHNKAGETPDVIAVFLGTNDFSYYQDALGTADAVNYETLITQGSDGSFTYATPVTSCEAYAIMLHKMRQAYPNAEIYCLSLTARRDPDYTGDEKADVGQPTAFNASLAAIAQKFDCQVVDLENCGIDAASDVFDLYMGDKRVHPNALGMDLMSEAVISAMLGTDTDIYDVSFDLTNVTGDGAHAVLPGKPYSVTLTEAEGFRNMKVTVTMGGTDITASCYADGVISIPAVTGDVTVKAETTERDPLNFRWEMVDDVLTSVTTGGNTENALTLTAGSVSDGAFAEARYSAVNSIHLYHDQPWVVEWACTGDWSSMLLTSTPTSATTDMTFLFRTYNATGLLALGTYSGGSYHNYGIALADFGLDMTAEHTYRLENRIGEDGSNMVWLTVDGTELGAMNNYYIGGTNNQNQTVDWVNGRDFEFGFIGSTSHPLKNMSLRYLQVCEGGESKAENTMLVPLSQTISLKPDQFVVNSGGEVLENEVYAHVVNYELKKGHTLSISDTNYVFSVRKLVDGTYSTLLKEANTTSFTAAEDMTVGMLIRKPDKSAMTEEEIASVVIYDTQYGMKDVPGYAHRFTVEAETIDGGTHTTRAAIFLPPTYSSTGDPTRLIIMTNGYHGHLTDSVWNANTADDVALMKHYMEAGFAVLVVDNTAERTGSTPDIGNPQLVDSYFKAFAHVQGCMNVEDRFYIHSRSQGTYAAVRLMREHPELIKCAIMTGPVAPFTSHFKIEPAFVAERFGFDDLTGATYEADKIVGYDPYTDADGVEYSLPPTFWMMSTADATSTVLSLIDKVEGHGNDVTSKTYTDTDHSGMCRLNTQQSWEDALAYFNGYTEPEHRFCAWTVTKAATCTQSGSMRRECADCDHYETMELPWTGHNFAGGDACTLCDHVLADELVDTLTPIRGQFSDSTGAWIASDIYACVIGYELKAGHTLSISDENYVFAVRILQDGNYNTMVKSATVDSYTTKEDVTVAIRIRKPDKSALTAEELASIVLYDTHCENAGGKTISILGASMSTFAGTSNGAAAETSNSTIANNVAYYPNNIIPEVTLNDTWWMQAVEDLDLRLLVNNSWSGSSLLHERSGTVGAYVDRCVQLHDDTGDNAGETPDIIAIQMGTNDYQYYKDTLGTADIDYDTLIVAGEDGSYTYATPTTSLEAAAIVLHKISVRYPDAEVYYLNLSQRVDITDETAGILETFNENLATVCAHFGVTIVDIYNSGITQEDFDTFIGDGRVHPNKFGMDAYTEAFKKAYLGNHSEETAYTVDFQLENVEADYGVDKQVLSGKEFTCTLTASEYYAPDVKVTMNGADITESCYADGVVTIEALTGDVVITAKAVLEHTPVNYRWEFDGSDLASVTTDGNTKNALTKLAGSSSDGVFTTTSYQLEKDVVLSHELPWSVEWKSEGTWKGISTSGGRLLSSASTSSNDTRYIFKSVNSYLIAMGERTSSGSYNYGIALADHGIDGSERHTYRLENRIAEDGSNMIWLYVDGVEIGAMNNLFMGTIDQNTTSDWLSGKDFIFPYIGTDTHGLNNCSVDYVQVWENGADHYHAYTAEVTKPTYTSGGYTTYNCAGCGDSYVDDYTDAIVLHTYRWELTDNKLVSVVTDGNTKNALTLENGSITDGEFSNVLYSMDGSVHLYHDQPWIIEFKSTGDCARENSTIGGAGMLSSNTVLQSDEGTWFLYKRPANYLIALCYRDKTTSIQSGIALADHNIDGSELHTYRLENRIADDGSNMVWLYVDGTEIGAMNNMFVSAVDQGKTTDFLNGQDWTFDYMGVTNYYLNNCSIEYMQIWEGGADHYYYYTADGIHSIQPQSDGSYLFDGTYSLADYETYLKGSLGTDNKSVTLYKLNDYTYMSGGAVSYTHNGQTQYLYDYTVFAVDAYHAPTDSGIFQVWREGALIAAFDDLQSAVNYSQSGDTIEITADYSATEGAAVNKDITIDGNGHTVDVSGWQYAYIVTDTGAELVVKDLVVDGGADGFQVDYDSVTYTNFTIPLKAGSLDNDPKRTHTPIITKGSLNAEKLAVRNSYTASYGGAISMPSGSMTLTDCEFTHNYGTSCGGAVYIGSKLQDRTAYPVESVVINGCTFADNYSTSGGAIYAFDAVKMDITGSEFTGNTANGGKGGAIDLAAENTTNPVGKALGLDYMQTTVSDCLFEGNWAGNDGFAIQTFDSDLYIKDSEFTANVGVHPTSSVGTVSIESYRGEDWRIYTSMDGCTFTGNIGPVSCYGDHSSPSDLDVTNCVFQENVGKCCFLLYSAVVNISDCRFVDEKTVNAVIDCRIYENYEVLPCLTLTDVTFEGTIGASDILVRKQEHNPELNTYTVKLDGETSGNIHIWDDNEVSILGTHTGNVWLDGVTAAENLTVIGTLNGAATAGSDSCTVTLYVPYDGAFTEAPWYTDCRFLYLQKGKTYTGSQVYPEKDGSTLVGYTDSAYTQLWNETADSHMEVFGQWETSPAEDKVHLTQKAVLEKDGTFTITLDVYASEPVALHTDAVIRIALSEGLVLSENSKVTAYEISGTMDTANAVWSETMAEAAVTITAENGVVDVTGYDFSSKYIAADHPGSKLRITVTGVEATENVLWDEVMDISTAASGIWTDGAQVLAVSPGKALFAEKTYVMDYAAEFALNNPNAIHLDGSGMNSFNQAVTRLEMTYGNAVIGSEGVVYTPGSMKWDGYDRFYVFSGGTDGYSWSRAAVIPANNVYYEDSFVATTQKASDSGAGIFYTNGQKPEDVTEEIWSAWQNAWTQTSDGKTDASVTGNSDVQGWIEELAGESGFSGGSAHIVQSMTGQKGDTLPEATFTFTGTGVDIYSFTNNQTGTILVKVDDIAGSLPSKYYIVDTLAASNGTAGYYQVPTISYTARDKATGELVYSTFQVTITVTTAAGEEEYGGRFSFYLDGIRVYDPLAADAKDETVQDAYGDELYASFHSVRSLLLTADSFSGDSGAGNGFVFIDQLSDEEAGNTNSIGVYEKQGPKNEVYLGKGQAIAFKVGTDVARVQVGLRSLTGDTVTAVVSYFDGTSAAQGQIAIAHTADMFYELTPLNGYVVIRNTSDVLLSVTKVKLISTGEPQQIGCPVETVAQEQILQAAEEFDTLPVAVYSLRSVPAEPEITSPTVDVFADLVDKLFKAVRAWLKE